MPGTTLGSRSIVARRKELPRWRYQIVWGSWRNGRRKPRIVPAPPRVLPGVAPEVEQASKAAQHRLMTAAWPGRADQGLGPVDGGPVGLGQAHRDRTRADCGQEGEGRRQIRSARRRHRRIRCRGGDRVRVRGRRGGRIRRPGRNPCTDGRRRHDSELTRVYESLTRVRRQIVQPYYGAEEVGGALYA
jgi:hypothetical protein